MRALWKKKGLTQREFCKEWGVSESAFSMWINEKSESKAIEEKVRLFLKNTDDDPLTDLISMMNGLKIDHPYSAAADRPGWIYILKGHGRNIKIGQTKNCDNIVVQAKRFNPNIEMIHRFETPDRVVSEVIAHKILRRWRLRRSGMGNEWFSCDVDRACIAIAVSIQETKRLSCFSGTSPPLCATCPTG